ncbi:MAG TPA: FAD-binding oxidoreductase [Candidatus Deferrimicrobium sp.]|nr:FAD-binding oxidoreductase [Candidatus Deferrimicrobium sp.]
MVKSEIVYERLESIVGEKNISTRDADKIAYGRDSFPLKIMQYRLPSILSQPFPDYIVWVETIEQISRILKVANEYKIPVIPYGGGAGVNGGIVALTGGIVIDLKKLKRIEIHEESNYVLCQAGVIGQHLENFLNKKGYTLGHLPSSLTTSTVGGFAATKSAGALSSLYGNIEDMVLDLEVVLPNGQIIHTNLSRVPRKATGPNFNELFIGSEGTFGIITDLCLSIKRNPDIREFAGFLFPLLSAGLNAVKKIMNLGIRPSIVRLYEAVEARMVYHVEDIGKEQSYLTLSFDGYNETKEFIEYQKKICTEICLKEGAVDMGDEGGKIWFKNRLNMYYPNPEWIKMNVLADTIDVVTTFDNLENLFNKMKEAMQSKKVNVMAHWSHFYLEGGSMYLIFVMLEKDTEKDQRASNLYKEAWMKGLKACIENGGSISHHHGIGIFRGDFMEQELGAGAFAVLKGIKKYLDPNNIMNPGKLGL